MDQDDSWYLETYCCCLIRKVQDLRLLVAGDKQAVVAVESEVGVEEGFHLEVQILVDHRLEV